MHSVPDYDLDLPSSVHHYLGFELDWDSEGVESDLSRIAHVMVNWEEKLSNHMGLTEVHIHDVKNGEFRDKPELQRYSHIICSTII